MCHGLWLGGEPLDTGKGLYSRTENRSISTPNTSLQWWRFSWTAYEKGTVTQLYTYLRGEMLDEVSPELGGFVVSIARILASSSAWFVSRPGTPHRARDNRREASTNILHPECRSKPRKALVSALALPR
ncbi:Uncharacterized protein TCM_035380 [Theobroma cacao]|uniref:Uncharacterized protein n=1 Tax=Theobroma cacao TaxID=3641 RepID=A0A061FHP0_THECC|nr:Uncharacterized protein TCM_035380 [Theobroma cacao]